MPRKWRDVSCLLLWNLIFKIPHRAVCLQSTSKTRRKALEDISKNAFSITSAAVIVLKDPLAGHALTPQEAATAYDFYAASYDELDGGKAADILGLDQARSTLFRQARGSVLEIGVGTGLNLEKYDPSKLESLTLVDVSQGMLGEAKKRVQNIPGLQKIPVRFIQADATSELVERFGANSFDTVVDSFSFCVMGTQGAKNCLEQMKKVVKTKQNNGLILLLENTRSSNPLLGIYQDATAEAVASAGGKGCVYNQDVTKLIKSSIGIEIVEESSFVSGFFRSYLCRVSS
jgi:methyltransferase OMS1